MISNTQKQLILHHLLPIKPDKIGIFGSYARGENKEGSDLDILLHLNYSIPISLLRLAGIQQKISNELGVQVELITEKSLSPFLRPYIEKDLIYIFG